MVFGNKVKNEISISEFNNSVFGNAFTGNLILCWVMYSPPP